MRKLLDNYLWRSYRQLSAITFWLHRRFTPAGKLILIILFFSALLGIDIREAQSYQLFSISLVLIVIALFSSIRKQGNYTVARRLPKYGCVGDTITYQFTIQNIGIKKITRLAILDVLADPRPTKETFFDVQEPKSVSANSFDRFFRFPRWKWLMEINTFANTSITDIPDLLPNEQARVSLTLEPVRRGIVYFKSLEIFRHDTIGLYRAKKSLPCYDSLVILPKRYQIPLLQLPGKRQHNPGGISNASSVGDAQEFVSLREYRPGDNIKRIHWNSWAKTNTPVVKQYQEEYFSRYGLILDTFCNNEKNEQFEEAVSLAASFIYSLYSTESFIDLMFVTNKAYLLSTGRGVTQREHLLEVLASVTKSENKNFVKLSAKITENLSILSGAIFIFIEWDEKRQQMLALLRCNNIPYQVFLIQPKGGSVTEISNIDSNITILQAGNIDAGLAEL